MGEMIPGGLTPWVSLLDLSTAKVTS